MVSLQRLVASLLGIATCLVDLPAKAGDDLCTTIMALTIPKNQYVAPVERVELDVNNIGETLLIKNVYIDDEAYIKVGSEVWKKAKIAKIGETRDHVKSSFGRQAKCEDLGANQSLQQPTHLYHVTVFNDRNNPGVYIDMTTDAATGEPLAEAVEWVVPEPKFYERGEPRKAQINWRYEGVSIPVAELDLTLPSAR